MTDTDLRDLARALNLVTSTAQARAAGAAALAALHRGYDLVPRVPGSLREMVRRDLDRRRAAVEEAFRATDRLDPGSAVGPWWKGFRRAIEGAYIDLSSAERVVGYQARTSNWDILADSIREAPGVLGRAVGETASAVGNVAGGVVGGALGGLGVWAPLILLFLLVVLFLPRFI